MIVQKEFLNKLKEFGLNSYESKLWTALLSRGVSTAGELSDIANVPRSRSYDVLESLEKKGFIMMKLGKPIKYLAVPPEEVFERVKKRIKEESERQAKALESLKGSEVLEELKMLHNQGIELVDSTDLSGAFKGRNNIYNHIELMLKNAKKSITICTTKQGFLRKAENFKRLLEKAKERGVNIRIAAPITPDSKEALKAVSKFADVRHSSDFVSRFVIVDGKEMAFMLLDDKDVHPSYDVGVWVNTDFFANTMEKLFDAHWKNMKPMK